MDRSVAESPEVISGACPLVDIACTCNVPGVRTAFDACVVEYGCEVTPENSLGTAIFPSSITKNSGRIYLTRCIF